MAEINFGSLNQNSTAQDKAGIYGDLLGQGFTDAQIRDAATQQFGPQSDSDWFTLTNMASQPTMSFDQNWDQYQKAGYYNDLIDQGYNDGQIRASASQQIGPQSDSDWNYLERSAANLAGYQSPLIRALRASNTTAPEAPSVTLRENKANADPIEFNLEYPETISYKPPMLSPGDPNTNLASSMYYFDQAGNQSPQGDQSPQQKASYYNSLIGAGYEDSQIRDVADQQFGQQTDDDWSYLTVLANLPNDLKTADDKVGAYRDLIDQGYTDAQIRWAADQDYGIQSDADWDYLLNLVAQTANQDSALSPAGPSGYSQAAEETLASIPNATSIAAEYDDGYLINVGQNDDAYQVFVNKDGTVEVQTEPSGLIGGEFA